MALKVPNINSPVHRTGLLMYENKDFGGKIVAKQNDFNDKINVKAKTNSHIKFILLLEVQF
jgi:hypothetical protein